MTSSSASPQFDDCDRDDNDDNDSEAQMEFAQEIAALRVRERSHKLELRALHDKVATLTTQLGETTDELSQRAAFAAQAVGQIARLEADVSAAKRLLLSKEMDIHDAAQRTRQIESDLRGKQQECAHWEAECLRVQEELASEKRSQDATQNSLDEKKHKAMQWKARAQQFAAKVIDMTQQIEHLRASEQQMTRAFDAKCEEIASTERVWEGKLKELRHENTRLQQRLNQLKDESRRAELDRSVEVEAQTIQTAASEKQQLEKREQVAKLRDQLSQMVRVVNKLRVKDELFRREVFRLREELLLSESQRETDQRRHEQLVRGKDKEVGFIWKKYVDAVSLRRDSHRGGDVCSAIDRSSVAPVEEESAPFWQE